MKKRNQIKKVHEHVFKINQELKPQYAVHDSNYQ